LEQLPASVFVAVHGLGLIGSGCLKCMAVDTTVWCMMYQRTIDI